MSRLLEGEVLETAEFAEIKGKAEDITEMEKTIDEELKSIFSEFGGDDNDVVFKIRVSRVMKDQGQEEICFYCIPAELPIFERIKNEYGPGMYKIVVFRNNLKFKNRTLNIAAQLKQPVTKPESGENMAAILATMAEMQQRNFEQMQNLIAMQSRIAQPAPAQQQTSLVELVTALSQLNGIMPKPSENNSMDMLFKGMELMKDFAGDAGGGREKGLYDMLIEAAKTFGGPIVEMAKTTTAALPQPGAQQPGGVAVPPGAVMYTPPGQPGQLENAPPMAVQTEQVKQSEVDQMGMMLTMQVNNLVNQAAAGKDPALYADLIIDNMSEAQIREFLGQPDLKAFLVSINPNVSNYWPWFEKLQSEVMAGLTMPETPADTPIITTDTPEPSADAIEPSATGNTPENT